MKTNKKSKKKENSSKKSESINDEEADESMKKEIEVFQAQALERIKTTLLEKARQQDGITIVTGIYPIDAQAAKDLAFKIRQAVPDHLLCALGTTGGNKPLLTLMLSDDMVKDHGLNAGQMVREAAKFIQGGGGGQPHFASAGGKNLDGLSAAVDKLIELAL